MDAAIAKARRRLVQFIAHLQHPGADGGGFEVKVPIRTDSGNLYHLWLKDLVYRDRTFVGKVASEPLDIKRLKLGDTLTVKEAEISDWVYVENGVRQGGFTADVIDSRPGLAPPGMKP